MEEIKEFLIDLKKRIENLEAVRIIRNLVIPDDGKFVVDKKASDPTVENGRIYYNTTSHKFRGCANGVWVDLH